MKHYYRDIYGRTEVGRTLVFFGLVAPSIGFCDMLLGTGAPYIVGLGFSVVGAEMLRPALKALNVSPRHGTALLRSFQAACVALGIGSSALMHHPTPHRPAPHIRVEQADLRLHQAVG